ncbi:MAG: LysM peptidoglycan-binding domain-containing protein [bacterium]|nr:LysM peptidoglycan-binding domain-containing protein [bacterium]
MTKKVLQPLRRFRPSAPRCALLAVVCLLPALALPAQVELRQLDARLFPVPETLQPNVAFWTAVYAARDSHNVLVHDERYLNVVYAIVDFSRIDAGELSESQKQRQRRHEIRKVRDKYRALLRDLAAGRTSSDDRHHQERIAGLFAAVPGGREKYLAAIDRIRTQTCLKDRFAEGIERSGRYLPAMEEIFRRRGLPVELTRLPLVESLFQTRARSSADAVGIWQFVHSTGRLYLTIGMEFDERYDPLRATEAAAELLTDNYQALRSWPLAVTAYNHGKNGIARAVRRLGTRDLGQIAARYRSRAFGFASRNFYSEFLAAATIYENRTHYFPATTPAAVLRFEEFVAPSYVSVRELAKAATTSLETLRELNPALASEVWADTLYLPRSYPLRVPPGHSIAFQAAYDAVPEAAKSAHQVGLYYRVRRGDTLSTIARRFGTSVGAVQRANGLRSPHRIRQGQRLLIPPGRGSGTTVIHVVSRGETLSKIARRYGVAVSTIMAANNLRSPDRIYVGQRLRVPSRV